MSPVAGSSAKGEARRAEGAARQAGESHWIDRLARVGFMARGVTYLLVGYFALQIAFGGSHRQASRNGAFHAIAQHSWGLVLLWIMALGFFGMAAWRLTEAIWGHGDEDNAAKKAAKKAYSFGRAVLYAFIGYSAASLAAGSGSSSSSGGSGSSAHSVSADLMKKSYGRPLIVVIGIAVIIVGIALAWRGATTKFEKKLKTEQMSERTRKLVEKVGAFGMIGRGAVVALIGIFLVDSAVTFDPNKAKGLDGSLRQLASYGWGKFVLVLVALGLLAFGVYSFFEARYRRTGNERGSGGQSGGGHERAGNGHDWVTGSSTHGSATTGSGISGSRLDGAVDAVRGLGTAVRDRTSGRARR